MWFIVVALAAFVVVMITAHRVLDMPAKFAGMNTVLGIAIFTFGAWLPLFFRDGYGWSIVGGIGLMLIVLAVLFWSEKRAEARDLLEYRPLPPLGALLAEPSS